MEIDKDLLVVAGISIFVSFLFLTYHYVGNLLDYYLWYFGGLCIGILPMLIYVFNTRKKNDVEEVL